MAVYTRRFVCIQRMTQSLSKSFPITLSREIFEIQLNILMGNIMQVCAKRDVYLKCLQMIISLLAVYSNINKKEKIQVSPVRRVRNAICFKTREQKCWKTKHTQ